MLRKLIHVAFGTSILKNIQAQWNCRWYIIPKKHSSHDAPYSCSNLTKQRAGIGIGDRREILEEKAAFTWAGVVGVTAGDAPISSRQERNHGCNPRQNLPRISGRGEEKALWRSTGTPAQPPSHPRLLLGSGSWRGEEAWAGGRELACRRRLVGARKSGERRLVGGRNRTGRPAAPVEPRHAGGGGAQGTREGLDASCLDNPWDKWIELLGPNCFTG
jgi:hypothetical protein